MMCPCCQIPLIITHMDRYQSTEEHVSSPNSTPSMKDGYQCMNRFCPGNNMGAVWTSDGELFLDPPDGVTHVVALSTLKKHSVNRLPYALGSWTSLYEETVLVKKEDRLTLQWGKWRIHLVPEFSTEKVFLSRKFNDSYYRLFTRKLELWKKTVDDEGYTMVVPFNRMVSFHLRKFSRALESKDWESCWKIMRSYTFYGAKDLRNHSKFAAFLTKASHPLLYLRLKRRFS